METIGLNHLALQVSDVERSVQFYTKALGLRIIPRPAFSFPGAWLSLGNDQELHLIAGRLESPQSSSRGFHFAFGVKSLDDWQIQLESLGVEILSRKFRPDGAEQLFLLDPDGHVIELTAMKG